MRWPARIDYYHEPGHGERRRREEEREGGGEVGGGRSKENRVCYKYVDEHEHGRECHHDCCDLAIAMASCV